jgi:SET domain-containing protein
MLMVSTYIKLSEIHGLGLFSNQKITAGTVVWQYIANFDFYISIKDYDCLNDVAKQFINFYGNIEKDKYLVCVDNARFMNHSNNPNISSASNENIALRDILKDEEILCDYRKFDTDFIRRFPQENIQ